MPAHHGLDGGLDLSLYRQHDDMWLSDGSVVLVAENTLFKVHKSQLARHSVAFRDMFALSTPAKAAERVDGCDVVRLHDSWQDVESLLRALYDGPSFGNNSEADFAVVSGVLRLSNKYLIEPLRVRCIAHLSSAWPCTLAGWDAREELAERTMRGMQSPRSDGSGTPPADALASFNRISSFYPHPARVVLLAREVNAPVLLPSAFYDLARHSILQLLAGSVAPTTIPLSGSPNASFDNTGGQLDIDPTTDALGISPADFRRLVLGKEAASSHIRALIRALGAIRAAGHSHGHSLSGGHSHPAAHMRPLLCMTPAACRKDFVELAELAAQHYIFDRHYGSADPLYVAEEVGQQKSSELGSPTDCRACTAALETWGKRERDRIWRLLPTWFHLDNWDAVTA